MLKRVRWVKDLGCCVHVFCQFVFISMGEIMLLYMGFVIELDKIRISKWVELGA